MAAVSMVAVPSSVSSGKVRALVGRKLGVFFFDEDFPIRFVIDEGLGLNSMYAFEHE